MVSATTAEVSHRTPPFGGSLVFLLTNLPLGVVAFGLLTGFISAGIGSAVVWVGVALLALVVLAVRGAARLEPAPAGRQAARPLEGALA